MRRNIRWDAAMERLLCELWFQPEKFPSQGQVAELLGVTPTELMLQLRRMYRSRKLAWRKGSLGARRSKHVEQGAFE